MAKQFGLLIQKGKIKKPAIFDEDSDSDGDLQKPTGISTLKKQEKMAQEKVMAEDPTVYQYDEVYDDMQSKRKESKLARKDLDKKPKYINKLLESADRRKRENERRIERQVQKEREEEGDTYKDKESFVTSAYRKKLEEMKELEEKEKREEYLENIGDVRKQGDLSGFYRHLYAQKVNYDEEKTNEAEKKDDTKDKEKESDTEEKKLSTEATEKSPTIKTEKSSEEKSDEEAVKKSSKTNKRKYRKREDSKSENEEGDEQKLEHLPSNIDADSDFSIDSESDSETEFKKPKLIEDKVIKKEVIEEDKTSDKNEGDKKIEDKSESAKPRELPNTVKVEEEVEDKKEEIKVPEVPQKPKIDIWKKRTVGAVFDEALIRYYERKAAKMQAV